MTRRNNLGTNQMYLRGFTIMGKFQEGAARYGTPMNLARLFGFFLVHLANDQHGKQVFEMPAEWEQLDVGSDLDFAAFRRHLPQFLAIVHNANRPGVKVDRSPLYTVMQMSHRCLAVGGLPEEMLM